MELRLALRLAAGERIPAGHAVVEKNGRKKLVKVDSKPWDAPVAPRIVGGGKGKRRAQPEAQ